jgi:hypothetical protein
MRHERHFLQTGRSEVYGATSTGVAQKQQYLRLLLSKTADTAVNKQLV